MGMTIETRTKEVVEMWKHRLESVKRKANLANTKMHIAHGKYEFEYWAERYSNNMRIFNQMLNNRPQGA